MTVAPRVQALVAIARRILVAIYYILRDQVPYRELSPSYVPSAGVARRIKRLVAQLQSCGQAVELKPIGTTGSSAE